MPRSRNTLTRSPRLSTPRSMPTASTTVSCDAVACRDVGSLGERGVRVHGGGPAAHQLARGHRTRLGPPREVTRQAVLAARFGRDPTGDNRGLLGWGAVAALSRACGDEALAAFELNFHSVFRSRRSNLSGRCVLGDRAGSRGLRVVAGAGPLLLLDRDPQVRAISSPPFWLHLARRQATVSPRSPGVAGRQFEWVGRPDPVLMANVRWLARCRRARSGRPVAVAERLLEVLSEPKVPVGGEGAELVGDRIQVLPVLFHLLWSGKLEMICREGSRRPGARSGRKSGTGGQAEASADSGCRRESPVRRAGPGSARSDRAGRGPGGRRDSTPPFEEPAGAASGGAIARQPPALFLRLPPSVLHRTSTSP